MFFIAISQITLGAIFLFRNALQATNHSFKAMIASIIQALFRIFIAIFFPMFMGFYGVAVATPISWLISALALIIISIIYIFKKLPNEDVIITNVESED